MNTLETTALTTQAMMERLDRVLHSATLRNLRVITLRVSRHEHALLCRLKRVPLRSLITYAGVLVEQVVSE